MNRLLATLVITLALGLGSTALAGYGYVVRYPAYVAPGRVVTYYAPAAPVYVAAAPAVTYFPPYYEPVMGAYPAVVYPAPAMVRARILPYGQPVRNALRVVFP